MNKKLTYDTDMYKGKLKEAAVNMINQLDNFYSQETEMVKKTSEIYLSLADYELSEFSTIIDMVKTMYALDKGHPYELIRQLA